MRILIAISFLFVTLGASDQIPAPPQDHPILLKGGTLYTVSNGVRPNTDILFDKGKIVRMGTDLTATPEMEVISIAGKYVYPGFITAVTPLGLVEVGAVRATVDYAEVGSINPNVQARVSYNPDSELLPVTRSNGVLLANVTPLSGLLSGQSSLMMLDGWTWEDATLQHPTALHLHWPSMSLTPGDPKKKVEEVTEERLKRLREIDELFEQSRAYGKLLNNPRKRAEEPVERDLRLEGMLPFVNKERPVFVHANEVRQIEAAVHWAERQDVRIAIVGGKDAWRITDLLVEKDIPVIYEGVLSNPSRRFEDYDQAYKTPAQLYEAGVRFCIAAKSNPFEAPHQRNLPYYAAMAAAYGLPREVALRSITLSVAEILEVDSRVGSLDPGKDATLFVSDGDPLDIRTNVEQVFIQGKKIDLSDRHKMLYKKYQEKYRQLGKLP